MISQFQIASDCREENVFVEVFYGGHLVGRMFRVGSELLWSMSTAEEESLPIGTRMPPEELIAAINKAAALARDEDD